MCAAASRSNFRESTATACRKGFGLVLHGTLVQINGFRTVPVGNPAMEAVVPGDK